MTKRTLVGLLGSAGLGLAVAIAPTGASAQYWPEHHDGAYRARHGYGYGYNGQDRHDYVRRHRHAPAYYDEEPHLHCRKVLVHTWHGHHWRRVCS